MLSLGLFWAVFIAVAFFAFANFIFFNGGDPGGNSKSPYWVWARFNHRSRFQLNAIDGFVFRCFVCGYLYSINFLTEPVQMAKANHHLTHCERWVCSGIFLLLLFLLQSLFCNCSHSTYNNRINKSAMSIVKMISLKFTRIKNP